jgi:methylenetetrahydrofolate dehydrogenase (NADP+)/methenyltetrahydrofolate cyclohydrolase
MLLDGKAVAAAMKEEIAAEAAALTDKGVTPTLAIVRMGEKPADLSYEKGALKIARELGINVRQCALKADALDDDVFSTLDALNDDARVHGVLVLRPLPPFIDDIELRYALHADKDIDGISYPSMAHLYSGRPCFAPCTAEACLHILNHYNIDPAGKRAVVIGRSTVIGKPVALMLLQNDATVTLCHSKTAKLPEIVREADIVIAAMGRPLFLGAEYFRAGQYVIDVGINAKPDGGKGVCGDVDFARVEPLVAGISPVPGGVGAVTQAVLMAHVVAAAKAMIKS